MRFYPGVLTATVFSISVFAADTLKVYISADMEGIGGVSTWDVQALPKGREYEKFRRLMTLEANAGIQGAFDAGATEVLVAIPITTRRTLTWNCSTGAPAWYEPGRAR